MSWCPVRGRRDGLGQEFADYLRREFIRESEHSGASWDAVNELAVAALDKGRSPATCGAGREMSEGPAVETSGKITAEANAGPE